MPVKHIADLPDPVCRLPPARRVRHHCALYLRPGPVQRCVRGSAPTRQNPLVCFIPIGLRVLQHGNESGRHEYDSISEGILDEFRHLRVDLCWQHRFRE